MNRTGVVLLKSFVTLGILTWLVGCGGGGGGSGLQTTLRGNIRSAPAGSAPSATPTTMAKLRPDRLWSVLLELWEAKSFAQVPGIGISVPDASMTTDAGGSFRLSTSHFGPGVVHFTGNGLDVSLPVTVPAGGELLLQDIDLTQSQATVRRQRLTTSGALTAADCQTGVLQLLSGNRVAFTLVIIRETVFLDPSGQTIACSDLPIGPTAQIGVQGNVDAQGNVQILKAREGGFVRPTPVPTP